MSWSAVPEERIRNANSAPINRDGSWVLYWMVANRRVHFNYALQRAAEWARHLGRPLVILEALRCDYPWASDRLHRFVLDGMADTQARLARKPVVYHPYVEDKPGAGQGLVVALAASAAVVISDDFPCFFIPRMLHTTASRLGVRFELVDSNGILPMIAGTRDFPTAYAFRRHLQKSLRPYLRLMPLADPLATELSPPTALPEQITSRWPRADRTLLAGSAQHLAALPIDHEVSVTATRGGAGAAENQLHHFLSHHLAAYGEHRNRLEEDTTSGLAPYLHFGHVGAHQVVLELLRHERWSEEDLGSTARGSRTGWWGVPSGAEAFLDQIVTWRELGFNNCFYRNDYNRWSSLPSWAQTTLGAHANDPREHCYSADEFATASTHDELWNAAQRQLRREGRIHNYVRMLWGKKILEWSRDPREALTTMVELNNRWSLDGRDPNSYTGIFWVLGRHDRPWAPERPIFGTVRYMSSANTARKMPVRRYLERFA